MHWANYAVIASMLLLILWIILAGRKEADRLSKKYKGGKK